MRVKVIQPGMKLWSSGMSAIILRIKEISLNVQSQATEFFFSQNHLFRVLSLEHESNEIK